MVHFSMLIFIIILLPVGKTKLNVELITVSYVTSLVANLIVLLGVTTGFVWLREISTNNFIKKHHNGIISTLGILFILFIHYESWSNNRLGQTLIGFHWTYFNVEILIFFELIMLLRTKIQLLSTIAVALVWFKSVFNHPNVTSVVLFSVLFAMILGISWGSPYLMRRWWIKEPLFYVYTMLIFEIARLSNGNQDVAGWMRQWGAIVILRSAVVVYYTMLEGHTQRLSRLQRKAEYDDLTGLRKLGVFTHDLEARFHDFRVNGASYAIVAVDIDFFKKVNDTYGHIAGSDVIEQVATRLQAIFAAADPEARTYRTGGEEFTAIVQMAPDDGVAATKLARQIQTGIAEMSFAELKTDAVVTVSVGESAVLAEDHNYLDAYKRADQYLYNSKSHGRNIITVQGRLIQTELAF